MQPTMIYLVSDGKPGHHGQSQGLAQAIGRRVPTRVMEFETYGPRTAPQPYKDAGLILSAGRSTRGFALSLRRYLGVPAVSMMNPGWIGRQRFDLSIIPRHDGIAPSSSVILTDGAINTITPSTNASPTQGLLLIGGPSKHHRWDESRLQQQLALILKRDPETNWTATSSRRTPGSTDRLLRQLADQHADRLVYTPVSKTPPGWVAQQLERCGTAWVTEDSVSMVYEALTAGARVGLLDIPRKARPGRVVRGVESLVERGWVTAFEAWQADKPLSNDRPPLAEADRVAELILQRWPRLDPTSGA